MKQFKIVLQKYVMRGNVTKIFLKVNFKTSVWYEITENKCTKHLMAFKNGNGSLIFLKKKQPVGYFCNLFFT